MDDFCETSNGSCELTTEKYVDCWPSNILKLSSEFSDVIACSLLFASKILRYLRLIKDFLSVLKVKNASCCSRQKQLVGGLVAINFIFPYIGNFIIPIDFHIFQRGGPGPPTRQFLWSENLWMSPAGDGEMGSPVTSREPEKTQRCNKHSELGFPRSC